MLQGMQEPKARARQPHDSGIRFDGEMAPGHEISLIPAVEGSSRSVPAIAQVRLRPRLQPPTNMAFFTISFLSPSGRIACRRKGGRKDLSNRMLLHPDDRGHYFPVPNSLLTGA